MLTVKNPCVSLRLLQTIMQIPKLIALFVLFAALFARVALVRACAVCISGADGSVADAYDWSVLFLMMTPYLVIGSITGCLVYAYRRATAKPEQQPGLAEAPVHLALDQKESGR
jgi:hypothetical protein